MISGADDSDRLAPQRDGNPVACDAHARCPSQGLAISVAGPDEEQEVETRAESEQNIQSRRTEHSDGEEFAWGNSFGELTVYELSEAVGEFE